MLATRLDVQDLASIDHAMAAGIARLDCLDALINEACFGLSASTMHAQGDRLGRPRPARPALEGEPVSPR